MKILLVGSYLAPDIVGGAESSAANLQTILEAAGHSFVTLRWRLAEKFTLGVDLGPDAASPTSGADFAARTWRPFAPITPRSGLAKAGFYLMELLTRASLAQMRQFVEENHIDMILVNSFRGLGYDVIDKLCQTGVPIIFFLHDFALACMNKGMTRKGKPCEELCLPCRHVSALNRTSLEKPDKFALVAPSRYVLNAVTKALQLDGAHSHHIPNPNTYTTIKRVRDHNAPLTLGYIGRLDTEKGVDGLLGIADRLHADCGLRLVIAGGGLLANTVTEFAGKRPWVDFRGQVPADRVHDVYNELDILAIPSMWPENFPGVAVHAMSSGLPCVGFDIGGMPEVIDHAQTGFVVPYGDFAGLADRIVELNRNRGLLAEMSRASLETCARYEPAALAARWVHLIAAMA